MDTPISVTLHTPPGTILLLSDTSRGDYGKLDENRCQTVFETRVYVNVDPTRVTDAHVREKLSRIYSLTGIVNANV